MANVESSQALTAQQVAASFVQQYYMTLIKDSKNLYKFYKEASTIGVAEIDKENIQNVTGLENITAKLNALQFQDSKLKVLSFDAQSSVQGSVLVSVYGTISSAGTQRRFHQTFVLAEQKKGYYVYNDMLRYFHMDSPIRTVKTVSPATTVQTPTQTKEAETETHSDHDSTNATVGTGSILEDATDNDDKTAQAPVKTVPVSTTNTNNDDAKKKQTPPKNNKRERPASSQNDGPKTYAAIVGGDEYTPPPAPVTESKPSSKDNKYKSQKSNRSQHTVHISRLHPNATEEEIKKAMEAFGKILDISYTPVDGFAYVYYSTEEEAENAIKNRSSILIHGISVNVEKKKRKPYNPEFSNNNTSRGGFRGRGRGNFRGQTRAYNGKNPKYANEQE